MRHGNNAAALIHSGICRRAIDRSIGAGQLSGHAGKLGSRNNQPCNDYAGRALVHSLRHVENKMRVWPNLIDVSQTVRKDGDAVAKVEGGARGSGD
jgi:hypothetical protein